MSIIIATVGVGMQFSNLQAALNSAVSGETIELFSPTAGANFNTALSNITIQGMSSAAQITSPSSDGEDGIDAEPGMANGLTIEGITFDGTFSRAAIRIEQAGNVSIINDTFEGSDEWAAYTSFNTGDIITGNTFTSNNTQHAIYVANSPANFDIAHNLIEGTSATGGLQVNGDASEGGTGLAVNGEVNANVIMQSGATGAAINLDGVQYTEIEGNIITGADHTGIAVFMQDGSAGPVGDVITLNVVTMVSQTLVAVEIEEPAGVNYYFNNTIVEGTVNLAPGTVTSAPLPEPASLAWFLPAVLMRRIRRTA
jgi:hypothetical protein